MSYKHLTINDRNKIEVLSKEGYSSRRIAKILGFHHSTISRELKRCDNEYEAVYAQKIRLKNHHLKEENQKLMIISLNAYWKNFIRNGLLSKYQTLYVKTLYALKQYTIGLIQEL